MFSVQQYQQELQTVLAACDESLLGMTLQEGNRRLDVSHQFYGGQKADAAALATMMQGCTIGNFVGEETVAVAIEAGIVSEANVATVEGVPHAQMVRL